MSVHETRLTAADWLERRQHPNWSAADQAALDAWLLEDGNMVAYLRVEAAWQCANRLSALRQPAQNQPMRAQKYSARSNVWPFMRRAAASLAIAAVIGAVAWQQWNAPINETHVTAIGGHKIIALRDGTRVELNTDTVLRISQSIGARKAWLDKGEAYFEVEHDASRPFIVIAQGRKVTDLGTKFAVRQDTDQLRVAVVEGLVEVEAKDKKPHSLLKPGDILTATAKAQSVTRKPLRTVLAALDWKNGNLFLDNTTLAAAAAEFNRYNTRKLIIHDPKVARLTIVGTFRTSDLDTFTNIATAIFGLKAEKTNNQIILSHRK